MKKIYGFGSATMDFRITTADYPDTYKSKLLAQKTSKLGGGAIANCLVQVARLGGKTCYLGKLGNDSIGKDIISSLKSEGISCKHIVVDKSVCSPFNVAVYQGEKMRRKGGYLLPNSLLSITKKDIIKITSIMKKNDWVIVEIGEIPLEKVLFFCQEAKKKHVHILLDVDLDPIKQCMGDISLINDIFMIADILLPNIEALKSMYNIDDNKVLLERLFEQFNKPIVMTAGKKGAYYISEFEKYTNVLASKVEVIDTVGAGDAFHGGLLFGLANEWLLHEAIKLGVLCGGKNCTQFGAREGMVDFKELYNKVDKDEFKQTILQDNVWKIS
ncbi:MAG: carbohydrate kinase family protein [Clostridiales bacterium]|nr:carbohydrate kinase family protein [Clostridiales bacterium]